MNLALWQTKLHTQSGHKKDVSTAVILHPKGTPIPCTIIYNSPTPIIVIVIMCNNNKDGVTVVTIQVLKIWRSFGSG